MSEPTQALTTSLPLRRGSEGFNISQDYLVKGLIPTGALCSIYGPGGSFKSFLAVSLACHVASGKPWSGRRVNQGAVLFIAGEGGTGVARRIRAWELSVNDEIVLQNLFRVDCPVFPASPESIQQVILATQDIFQLTGMPVRLIILDTLARCFGSSDENTARDMGAFIQGCDAIRYHTHSTMLIVHHSGKDQDRGARGSSAFQAALDAEFNVRREGRRNAITLSCTKMKDAEMPEIAAYDLDEAEICIDDDGEPVTSLVLNDSPRQPDTDASGINATVPYMTHNHAALWQCISQRINQNKPCTRALLRDDLRARGMNVDKKFSRWLEKLLREQLIILDGEQIRLPDMGE
ncbi:AAA family ATPase [Citrobacter freundii]|nr:AAA family ATPase [Citrobacter freundii]